MDVRREGLRGEADNLNRRHRNAQLAGRASVELHTLIFFKDRVVTADARVTKVRAVWPPHVCVSLLFFKDRVVTKRVGACAT